MTDLPDRYRARLRRVLDHSDRHPDGDLSLDRLSAVAAFSPHHFHRQFAAALGITVHRYVQLARLERASAQLAGGAGVTAAALDAGYAPEGFARAFRRRLGQRPSDFRTAPDWAPWLAAIAPLDAARSKMVDRTYSTDDVTVTDFPATPVAIMEHRGDPAAIPATVQRFVAWRRRRGLTPAVSGTYSVFHADPRTTDPAAYRLDLCAGTAAPLGDDPEVVPGLIPAGRCAMLRLVGGGGDLEAPALFLYRDWLPQSGEELRDFPLFCRRVSFAPAVPAAAAVTELYLPLR